MFTNKLFRLPASGFFAALTLAAVTHLSLSAQSLDRFRKGPSPIANPLRISPQTEASVSTAAAVNYEFVTVDVPGFPTTVYGINDEGLLSGFYFDPQFNLHGFIVRDKVLSLIDYPGAGSTALGGNANNGVVIGNYGASSSAAQHAVLYDSNRAAWTHLPDVPNYAQNFANGINNRNHATGGACSLTSLACLGWTWDGQKYSFFQAPGAVPALGGTYPNGINDSNEVAGYFVDSSGVTHGFLKDEDDFTVLDPPGSTYTFAADVNNREETVGWYTDANGKNHGFVEKHGKYTTVNNPNAVTMVIWGTNSRGDIVGAYADSSGARHGFVGYRR